MEQFSYKLGLILTHLAAWNPDQRTQVYTYFHHTGMSDCHTTCTMYMSCDYQHGARVLAKAIKGGGPPILLMLTAPIQLLSAPFQLPPALLLRAHARSVRLREFTVPRTRTPCDCVYNGYQRFVAAVASPLLQPELFSVGGNYSYGV